MLLHALLALSLVAGSDDDPVWNGFRGNNGVGVAGAASVPASLDPEETAMWRVEVPTGYSSPVVTDEHVFLTGAEGAKLFTLCLDRASGEELWRQELGFDGARVGMNSSAAPTPATDGERVYVVFHAVGLVAYTVDGDELWKQEIGPFNIPHGMSTSPVLVDDLVVLQVDQDTDAYLAAFDRKTGKQRWRAERPGMTHSYSTPAVYTPAEGPAQIIVSGSFQVRGYSAVDGKELWSVGGSGWQTKAVPIIDGDRCFVNGYMPASGEFGVPPVAASFEDELVARDADGDSLISRAEWPGNTIQEIWFLFDLDGDDMLGAADWKYMEAAAHVTGGLFAIDLTGEGDVTESHLQWKFDDRRGLPDCPSPIFMNDTLFLIKDGGLFTSIDPETGKVAKQGRVGEPDTYYASPVGAGGRIVTASASGQLVVVDAQREWNVVSVASLGETIWATPAIADGQVFVRTDDALWCFEEAVD